jgi:hypothetical protein
MPHLCKFIQEGLIHTRENEYVCNCAKTRVGRINLLGVR